MHGVGGFWGGVSLLSLLAAVTIGGCAQDAKPATALAIAVETNLQAELATVKVRAYAPDRPIGPETLLFESPAQPVRELDRPVVILPGGQDEVVIAVEGLDGKGASVVESRVRTRFVAGRTTAVPMYLAESCAGEVCGADRTCIGDSVLGKCGCSGIPVAPALAVTDPSDVTGSYRAQACESTVVCTPEPGLPGSTCNLTSQCGCKDQERCAIVVEGDRLRAACQPDNGAVPTPGRVCEDSSQCAAGYGCIGAPATCRHYCESDANCGGASRSCRPANLGKERNYKEAGYKTCVATCTSDSQCETGCCSDGMCAGPEWCGEPPPPPLPACNPESGDTACLTCNKRSCCNELSACMTDLSCSKFVTCVNACPTSDAACRTTCERNEPSGAVMLRKFAVCSDTSCNSVCKG